MHQKNSLNNSFPRILNYENNRRKPASMMDHGLHFYVYSFKIERTDISKLEKTSKLDIKHILVRLLVMNIFMRWCMNVNMNYCKKFHVVIKMKSILAILSTILIIGGISSAYSESISSQLERGLLYDQVQCDRLDHVFIGPITTSWACVHNKVAEEFKIPTYSTLPSEYNTTQNIVTTDFNFKKTDILESNETNFLTNIGDTILPDGSSLHYRSYFWPQYTMIFPKQVQVGEPFDVVLDYTFVLPSIEYVNNTGIEVWGNNSELQCPASECANYNIFFHTSLNVDLLNESNYTFVLTKIFLMNNMLKIYPEQKIMDTFIGHIIMVCMFLSIRQHFKINFNYGTFIYETIITILVMYPELLYLNYDISISFLHFQIASPNKTYAPQV